MSDAIIVGLISGASAIIAALTSSFTTANKVQHELDKQNAVQSEQIKELTREVRVHNGFTERLPKLETAIEFLSKRIDKLEGKNDKQ